MAGRRIGGWLAMYDIRLPWAIATFVHVVQLMIATAMLQETLPVLKRVPFRWHASNPLSFLKLFRSGRTLRIAALNSMYASLSGRYATYRYDTVHRQQLLGWDLGQRGRYESFSGIFEVGGSFLSGRIIAWVGARKSLYLGYASAMVQQLMTGFASKGWHFFAIRTTQLGADVSMVAMQYTQSAVGAAVGIPQGELQGSLSNLSTVVRVFTPLIWGAVFNYGLRTGRPSFIYFVCATSGVVQMLLVKLLIAALDKDGMQTGRPTQ